MVVSVTCGGESNSLKTSLSFHFVSVTAMEEDCLHSWFSGLLLSLKNHNWLHFLDDLKQTNGFWPHEHMKSHHIKLLDNTSNGKHFLCGAIVTVFLWNLWCLKCWDRCSSDYSGFSPSLFHHCSVLVFISFISFRPCIIFAVGIVAKWNTEKRILTVPDRNSNFNHEERVPQCTLRNAVRSAVLIVTS